MGEYVKYCGNDIKIGTLEDMYYATYQKYIKALQSGQLKQSEGNAAPSAYVRPDLNIRFRFPFPDEDKFRLGDIGAFDYRRAVPIKVRQAMDESLNGYLADDNGMVTLSIVQQRLVHRAQDNKPILALVLTEASTGELFRVEDERFIKNFCREITGNHIANEPDRERKQFYRQIAARILKGYHLTDKQRIKPSSRIKTHHHKKKGPGRG